MAQLPPEVVERLLMNLPPRDRINSALTCRLWAQVVSRSPLLEGIWLEVRGFELQHFEAVFIKSERQYRHLRLLEADLRSYTPELWTRIGRNLRILELCGCRWSPQVLYGILRECVKLESLRILFPNSRYDDLEVSLTDFEFPEGASLEGIRSSLTNVRHLHLDFLVAADVLAHLLKVMPNVISLSLSRFEERDDLWELIPSLLGPDRAITELNLELDWEGDDHLLQLLQASSTSLKELRCGSYLFTDEIFESVAECTKLRRLILYENTSCHITLDDELLEMLLLNLKELETLELDGFCSLEDRGLISLRECKNLRKLRLFRCVRYFSNELLSILGEIPTLDLLDLEGAELDVTALQSIARLPNLRTLYVSCHNMSSECLGVVFENFRNLEVLKISDCEQLTDADGMKFPHFEKLKSLTIADGSQLTDLAFKNGLGSQALESLTLRNCSLTDVGIASIVANHSNLKAFVLHDCRGITEVGVLTLVGNEPLLMELEVYEWVGSCTPHTSVTENVLKAVEEFCPRLRTLKVNNDCKVSSGAMERFRSRNPRVKFSPTPVSDSRARYSLTK